MKISKSKKNLIHSKIENIALKFLNLNLKKKDTKNNFSKNLEEYIKNNDSEEIFNNKDTKKDILTIEYQEKILKAENNSNFKENYFINNSNYFSINSIDKINIKEKSKIPKELEVVPKIQGLNEIAQNYINKLNQKNDESVSSSIINNTSESAMIEINYEILNRIYLLYMELKKEFDNIHNILNNQNSNNIIPGEEEYLKKIIFKCVVLGRDYYTMFLFGEEIHKIIKLFNYCLDVGKFIIYQIYLFLSLIYLNEDLPMKNNIEMSFRTLILYSSQNFQILLNLIRNPNLSSEPKIIKSIKIKNKIIISVLKLINPNIPSKEKIKEFIYKDSNNINNIGNFTFKCIEEIDKNNKDIKNNKSNIERRTNYNSLGIIKLILLLKKNKELAEKLIQIQKKVFLLTLNNSDNNQSNSKSENISRKMNNLNNNNLPNDISNKSDSLSSLNKDINININSNNNIKTNNLINIETTNTNQINTNNLQNNILPIIDEIKSAYKFFVFFELDETLVHYWEENDESYVKIRWGVEDCFSQISEFCEISIVSTSSQEYTEKIIEKFNKNGEYIKNKIYKEDDEDNLDLSVINRDMKKCIFICHEEEFFNAPKNNILRLTEFQGDERDREILFLTKEIMKLKDENINDISQIIPDLINNIRI